jgi:hypothetical protein
MRDNNAEKLNGKRDDGIIMYFGNVAHVRVESNTAYTRGDMKKLKERSISYICRKRLMCKRNMEVMMCYRIWASEASPSP